MMMMTIEQMVRVVQTALPIDRAPTEEDVQEAVNRVVNAFGASDDVRAAVLHTVQAQRVIRMNTGFAIIEPGDHEPWVDSRKAETDPFYWTRFETYLFNQGWPQGVITSLRRNTDEILDLLGNPSETRTWKRRGLVMGDVQSGKTAAYSALICKAADAGYKFIVLLTGTLENLRRQTQERLDEAFVGLDSSRQLQRNRQTVRVGVGEIDKRRSALVFTSSQSDFRAATLDNLGFGLAALNEPALVVIKKNTKILANLRDWIERYNVEHGGDKIDYPMLMIDDEADNASINTNQSDADPTKTNAGIREILALFRRSTYVGFTATPFANIFVDPDATEEMLEDDLFPRDFIFALEAPTNYFGPDRVFVDDEGSRQYLKRIDDVEAVIPRRHRPDMSVSAIPVSLLQALHQFLVSNAIRDLRGHQNTHRSMLVNVSMYTKVQDQVERLLDEELTRIKVDIRNFAGLAAAEALANESIAALHAAWQLSYSNAGFDWPAVHLALHDAVQPVKTTAVNQRTGARALDYKAHKKTGLRIVAVGGNSLSRGLTLEGLTVSYFRRNSQMYDTLLQMGRWFGYRVGYEDLCRVWLPQDAIDWYGHIASATDELRGEIRRMYDAKLTPKDFGLRVRASPDSLMVTARNKMRTAREIVRVISVSGEGFESVELPIDPDQQDENWASLCDMVADLQAAPDTTLGTAVGHPFFQNVSRQTVSNLLRKFRVPEADLRFQPRQIAELLDGLEPDLLSAWDVLIPSASGSSAGLPGLAVSCQHRRVRIDKKLKRIVVSGSKRRVGSRGIERAGLTDDQKAAAEEKVRREFQAEERKGPNVSDKDYRPYRTRPLLVLHFLDAVEDVGTREPGSPEPFTKRMAAIGLSFPKFDDKAEERRVKYKINLVLFRQLFAQEADDDDDTVEVAP